MKRHEFAFVIAMILIAASQVRAANPVGATASNDQVRQVLTLETLTDSMTVDRRGVLQPAVHPDSASNAAWWQSGFVRAGSGWHHAEKPTSDTDSELWQQYRDQREASPKTADAQLKLANWCRDHKLVDQERAHLIQVLMLSSAGIDQAAIYKRMGYHQLGQEWLSPADLHAQQESYRRDQANLREWRPVMERIVRNWNGNARQNKLARDELNGIESVAAIPALMAAARAHEALGLAICKQLETIPSFEASQSLATISVQSDWPSVRQAASKSLKGRRIDDFAPALLSQMRSPFSVVKANGPASESKLIFREEADRYYAIDLNIISEFKTLVFSRRLNRFLTALPDGFVSGRYGQDQSRYIDDFNLAVQHQLDEQDDRTDEYNRRAAAVLAEVTGQEPSTNPKYWWAWWHLHTGTVPLPKQTAVVRKGIQGPTRFRIAYISCLTAGTPICTDRGFVAIDKVQVGDRVLAKEITTGEIDYKPVLQTTVRPPVPVMKFVVDGAPITASEGHHFWVSGTGWSKTRELKTGSPIHTATGMSRVQSAETQADLAPVYNLVVADFHTYFIGPAMVLSHDVLQPSPTNVKVPGLD